LQFLPATMKSIALPSSDSLTPRDRACEIVTILAAAIVRSQCPTDSKRPAKSS
jgi:hypothetical protein